MFVPLAVFSALSFLGYGISCILSAHMAVEFERYGLARFRALTGVLQLIGAIGLTFGILGFPWVGLIAAAGLSLQMLLGVCVRIKIRDSFVQAMPAFAYMCLNAYIAYRYYSLVD